MNSIEEKETLQNMYKEAIYRAFDESEAIMARYLESNDIRSKLTLIHNILNKK